MQPTRVHRFEKEKRERRDTRGLYSMYLNRCTRTLSGVARSSVGRYRGRCLTTTPTHSSVLHPSKKNADSSDENENVPQYFAVVGLGGTQFKVAEGDLIVTNKLPDAEVGESFDVDDVLLVGSRDKTVIGRPTVPGAKVTMICEEQTKAERVNVFKKIRRQGHKRTKGFRREITVSRVVGVDAGGSL